MGRLVVIEGLDGAGKRTLTDSLTRLLSARGSTVSRLAFPRYGKNIHADLSREARYLRLGDVIDSVYAMALLYALDRKEATAMIRAELDQHDVVLVDRYVASNAAFGAARLHQDARGDFVKWLYELEIDRFQVPVPDLQLLLRVPALVASQRAAHRESTEPDRIKDSYESDFDLQSRAANLYDQLVEDAWLAAWHVVDGVSAYDFDTLLKVAFL